MGRTVWESNGSDRLGPMSKDGVGRSRRKGRMQREGAEGKVVHEDRRQTERGDEGSVFEAEPIRKSV